jgi:ATP-binding cassette subfamily A (ABC1) protein 3
VKRRCLWLVVTRRALWLPLFHHTRHAAFTAEEEVETRLPPQSPPLRRDTLLAAALGHNGGGDGERRSQENTSAEARAAPAWVTPLLRQCAALLRRTVLLKCRGWRQTAAEVVVPVLLMAALVVGAQLAEIKVSTEDIFANKPPVSTLLATARYSAFGNYYANHTAAACARTQLLAAAAAPSLASSLGWDTQALTATAASDADATRAVLAAFNLTTAELNNAQAALTAVDGVQGFVAIAVGLGIGDPKVIDALQAVQANPLNGSSWSKFADVAIPALLDGNLTNYLFGSASSNGTNSSGSSATSSLGSLAGGLFTYNGSIPIPSLDEFVAAHLAIRAVFSRFSPAWTAYRELKTQLGYNLLGNLVELGGIAFMPNTSGVRALASSLSGRHASWDSYYQGAYDDITTARAAATAGDPIVGPWAVVQFDSASPTSLRYAIRVRFTQVPSTWTIVDQFYSGLSTTYLRYITSGFLSIQRAIDEAALAGALSADPVAAAASVNSTAGTSALMWSIPFPVYSVLSNSFYSSSGPLLGLVICLSMIYPLGMLIKSLVEEKESGARELLRISGLRHWALGVSWSLVYVLLFVLIAGASTLVLGLAVFPHSGSDVLFGMLWLFMLSCVPLAFVISTAFTRARLAAIFGPFALFALVLPRYLFFRTSGGQSILGKRAACLLAPTAFTFAADKLASYEAGNSGVTSSNVWEGPLSVGECMAWMFVDTVLYSLLAVLLDYALPTLRRSGRLPQVAWPWGRRGERGGHVSQGSQAGDIQRDDADSAPGDVIAQLKALRKVFPNGVCAVDGLDLQLTDGTITALLGHNGAGKTTAISMLTGNVAPTSGTVTICGLGVAAAASCGLIGLCPQHNVLYPMLTVLDHLRMFAVLRGVPHARLLTVALDLVAEVGLQEQVRTRADALSGGMKRRLQLACALIGGARLILADEPTSGQDPINRRATWELLRKVRKTTSVLLTTHYLDEADLLADRVVILSDGCLRAAGSPLFLKRRLGRGYTLCVTTTGSADAVEAVVKQHAPGALRVRSAGGELAFQLAALQDGDAVTSHASDFVALLSALETQREALALGGVGISNATLEEVFLRLAREAPATADTAAFALGNAAVEMRDLKAGASTHQELDDGLATCLPFSPTKRRGAPLLGALESTTPEPRHSSTSPAFVTVDVADVGSNGRAHEQHARAPAEGKEIDETAWEAGLPTVRDATAMQRSFKRSFTEMLRKRVLIARRDYKAVAFQIALPVLAVGLVMLILSLNVNPTGPPLTLKATTLASAQQVNATPVWWPAQASRFPAASFTPAVAPLTVPASSLASVNSTVMSLQLLRAGNDSSLAPPYSYGAFVPRDVGLPVFMPALCLAGATPARAAGVAMRMLTSPSSSASEDKLAGALGRSLVLNTREVAQPAMALLHNTSSPHALPIWMSELRAASLRAVGGPELEALNHPLPLTADEQTTLATFLRLLASFFVLIPYSYAPATAAAAVVRERASGAKLQQLASGASSLSYWAAHFVFEMANLTVVIACCMLIFAGFGVDILVGSSDKALGTFLLLWLYSLAAVALSFFLSLPFDSHAAAIVAIACFNFVTGFCLVTASFIMSVTPSTADLNKQLVVFFRIFPTYNLGEGLLNLALSSFDLGGLTSATGGTGGGSGNSTAVYTAAAGAAPQNAFGNVALVAAKNAFDWNVLGRPLLLLVAEFCLLSVLVLLFHRGHTMQALRALAATYAAWLPLPGGGSDAGAAAAATEPDDETVEAERTRIQDRPADVLQLRGIRKVYAPRKVAVHGLWLGVPVGERLGLLGVNGAGKTTTLAMLCCDVAPTSGDAVVDGSSVKGAPQDVQRLIGYCPQKDPILELLTVREHLLLYARLKGIPENVVHAAVESTWRRVGLGPFADRPAGTLSGGNKRKLSLAIAIVGNPVACILDEPSSGMDVQARRHLWDVIATSTADMAVILTTHALDEAEALCGRIGIMVSGRLKCVGTPLQLKQRFGDGHVIDIKAASNPGGDGSDDADRMLAHVQALLPEAHVVERHGGKLRLGVAAPLSRIFAALDQAPCEDWAVSQASMESVFCKIAA